MSKNKHLKEHHIHRQVPNAPMDKTLDCDYNDDITYMLLDDLQVTFRNLDEMKNGNYGIND